VVLINGPYAEGDMWEYDGSSWALTLRTDPDGDGEPGPRYDDAYAYDQTRGRIVLHGGQPGADETWEWAPGWGERPGQMMGWAFGASGVADASLMRVGARAETGGTGYGQEGEAHGADLSLWARGFWRKVADGNGTADSPAGLTWTVSDPRVVQAADHSMFEGEEGLLALALMPTHANASRYSRVATDYVEITVDYSLGLTYGWGFDETGNPEGWTAQNVAAPGTPTDGTWSLVLTDPGPRLLLEEGVLSASVYTQLQVRMRNENQDSTCRFRWRHYKPTACDDLACSVELEIPGDGEWHVVQAALGDHPEWWVDVLQLALDLPAAPDGKTVEIDWIRLTE